MNCLTDQLLCCSKAFLINYVIITMTYHIGSTMMKALAFEGENCSLVFKMKLVLFWLMMNSACRGWILIFFSFEASWIKYIQTAV